ncbi:saccharopine dehydrogenase NADP-binding domain-containing protein, partial [Candidatus Dependentiae bacterium]|nr:saccharopine dehydrogenase NADP-binding domain-containing protein [Candidatus Dependentiae bacterium]
MKYIIAGAGKMARAVAYFLMKQKDTEKIFIFDSNQDALNYFKKIKKVKTIKKEFSKLKSLKTISKEADAVISCLPYFCNLKLTELAIKAGFNFIDLGGNNNIVKAQHKLDKKVKSKKISIVPDCGLAPGLVSLLAAYFVNYFDKVKTIKIYVGGLPVFPKPPLNYTLVFSVSGLINEYKEDVIVLKNNKFTTVKSLTGLEKVKIEKENYEAFFTSGGISTMPRNFKN